MSDETPCTGKCACPGKPNAGEPIDPDAAPGIVASTRRSVFRIPGMDCPAEEQMIRLSLADLPVASMAFDLPGRTLVIDHGGDASAILRKMEPLGYGAELLQSTPLDAGEATRATTDGAAEARILWILLGINFSMFIVEVFAGWWAQSAGLISDAADMFADAAVYGVALYAVGRSATHKLSAAQLSGFLQLALALGVLAETARRIVTGSFPVEIVMIGVSLLALAANVACLALISGHRDKGVHMRASYIFSANDVLANLGVIIAGLLVTWTGSAWPDWIIGLAIGIMLLIGAFRILRLK